jgi:hypothetical protein
MKAIAIVHRTEAVMEQDQRPIAILKPSPSVGRLPSEILADLKSRDSNATMDDHFAGDIATAIELHRQPWNPPSWD